MDQNSELLNDKNVKVKLDCFRGSEVQHNCSCVVDRTSHANNVSWRHMTVRAPINISSSFCVSYFPLSISYSNIINLSPTGMIE